MTEPIVEQIASALETRLRTISQANGYWDDLADVTRPRRQTITPRHRQIIILQSARTPEDGPCGHDQWTQPFQLHLVVRPPDNDNAPVDTHVNRLLADVDKALHAQPDWATLAIQWTLSGPDPLPEDLGLDGTTLTVNVSYRTLHGDPYHQ